MVCPITQGDHNNMCNSGKHETQIFKWVKLSRLQWYSSNLSDCCQITGLNPTRDSYNTTQYFHLQRVCSQSLWQNMGCANKPVKIVVFITTATTIYSLGNGLHSLTAVRRSTMVQGLQKRFSTQQRCLQRLSHERTVISMAVKIEMRRKLYNYRVQCCQRRNDLTSRASSS